MSRPNAALALNQEEVLEELGTYGELFAKAFAYYTIELLSLARERRIPLARRAESPARDADLPAGLTDAPEFVRDSYRRARDNPGRGVDGRLIHARVARDQLLLAMKKQGKSQADVARAAGMSPPALNRILKAPERSRVSTLRKIARVLKLDLSDII